MASGSLTALMSAGADAFTNLWDINFYLPAIIPNPKTGTSPAPAWSIRVSDFKPTEAKPDTYPSDYKGVQLTRMTAKFSLERVLEFTFRVDSAWNIVNDLKAWKHIFFDPSGDGNMAFGMFNDAISDGKRYGKIEVVGYTTNVAQSLGSIAGDANISANYTASGIKYVYEDVVCVTSGDPSFSRSESQAATVTASFMYGRFTEPFANGTDPTSASSIVEGIPTLTGT